MFGWALATRFHVSRIVVMRRALDLNLVDRAIYAEYDLAALAAFREKEGGGGDFYRGVVAKNSVRFSRRSSPKRSAVASCYGRESAFWASNQQDSRFRRTAWPMTYLPDANTLIEAKLRVRADDLRS